MHTDSEVQDRVYTPWAEPVDLEVPWNAYTVAKKKKKRSCKNNQEIIYDDDDFLTNSCAL